MISFACYIAAVLGFTYVVGQSRITLATRSVLARLVAIFEPDKCLCGVALRWIPSAEFESPSGYCLKGEQCPVRAVQGLRAVRASHFWYPFKWVVLLAECPSCLSIWVGAGVAMLAPDLAATAVPAPFVGVVPLALLTCGAVAFLFNLAGISGDPHV